MKLQQEESDIKIEGDFESQDARIAISKHAFAVLSKGMYSNPFRAIVRELACNAWDAHIAAGNTATPFDVYLPNTMAPTFKIRDYGVGMSTEFVLNNYNSYFTSTKQESETMTGCFGLGSKSPYAYTKKFTIVSFYNGVRSHFISFLNADGVPRTTKLAEEPTTEPNGVEVSFNVESCDFAEFASAARICLRPFPLKPVIHGVANGDKFFAENQKPLMEGKDWSISAGPGYDHVIKAVMGNVEYPISGFGGRKGFSVNAEKMFHVPATIQFPLGAFEITPSRESIQWTDFSVHNVSDRLEEVYDEIVEQVNQKIASCKTLWSATILANELLNGTLCYLSIPATWQGKSLQNVLCRVPDGYRVRQVTAGYPRHDIDGKQLSNNSASVSLISSIHPGHMKFFFSDFNGSLTRLTQHVRDDFQRHDTCLLITAVKEVDKIDKLTNKVIKVEEDVYDVSLLADFCKDFGIAEADVKLASSVPQRERKVSTRKSRLAGSQAHAFSFITNAWGESSDRYWSEADIDVNSVTSGVYVEISNWNLVNSCCGHRMKDFRTFLDNAHRCGITLPDEGLVGVKTADLKKFQKSSKWMTLDEYIIAKLEKVWKSKDFEKSYQIIILHSSKEAYLRSLVDFYTGNKKKFTTSEFGDLIEPVVAAVNMSAKLHSFASCANHFPTLTAVGSAVDVNTVDPVIDQAVMNLTTRYALLPVLFDTHGSTYYAAQKAHKQIIEYITLIDNTTRVNSPQ